MTITDTLTLTLTFMICMSHFHNPSPVFQLTFTACDVTGGDQ